jgi:hypothetical protein
MMNFCRCGTNTDSLVEIYVLMARKDILKSFSVRAA